MTMTRTRARRGCPHHRRFRVIVIVAVTAFRALAAHTLACGGVIGAVIVAVTAFSTFCALAARTLTSVIVRARGVIVAVTAFSTFCALAARALACAVRVVRAVAVAVGAATRQSAHELAVHADLIARAVVVDFARGHAAGDGNAAIAAVVALEALLVRIGAAA